MKKRVALFATVLLCMGVLLMTGFSSQQAEKPQAATKEEAPEAMMMKLAQPGAHHERLKAMVGKWEMTGKSSMSPAIEPVSWGGLSEKKMILGDRFLREEVHSEMMGQPFTGIGVVGYDNLLAKYVWIWMDDMSTGIMVSEGTCDDSGKILTLSGEYMDPMEGTMKTARSVIRIISEDKHVFEMYNKGPDGKEFKSMEITYVRS